GNKGGPGDAHVAHRAAVLQVLERGAEDLRAGLEVAERGHAQVLQAGGRRADDGDLAGELVRGARAPGTVEVLVQVAVGDAGEAAGRSAPGEHDAVAVRHRPAEVLEIGRAH